MATRLELQQKLIDILGSENVYFQPPATIQMSFPCFVYSLESPQYLRANGKVYRYINHYTLIYISRDPMDPMYERLLNEFDYISPDKPYKADNLMHYPFKLYF